MNIHEYQAKALLRDAGLPVLRGDAAFSVEQAVAAWDKFQVPLVAVKAQIHAGGRGAGHFEGAGGDEAGKQTDKQTDKQTGKQTGKGGGVRLCRTRDEVQANSESMLGRVLVTKQTGKSGRRVGRLYIEEGGAIERELYLSLLVDRQSAAVVVIASASGGIDIEDVAKKTPNLIHRTKIGIDGYSSYHGRKLAFALGLSGESVKHFSKLLQKLSELFRELDASLLEINPLVLQPDGKLLVMDAKMTFDDNALFRQPAIESLRDVEEEEPSEREANEVGLSYIKLDGTIACMVNGAGLAMATMDIVQNFGGSPANFLDVGGGADKDRVETAFRIILRDKAVEAILVNIFGGIMRCDIIAEGIVAAASKLGLSVPLVVRLQGTNFERGKEILASSSLNIIAAETLADAAEKAVAAAQGTNKSS